MTQARTGRDTVLVVDDSPETLSMLTDALEAAGMTVLVALEGEQALAMVEKVTPDAILMDAVMPGMDGFETTRALKCTVVSHVPVIFMTGLTETEHIVKAFAAGGVDYVTKPIVPDELLARMRVHLANARMAHGAQAALDASGRYLLAANPAGRLLWCTPQATKLLGIFTRLDRRDGKPQYLQLLPLVERRLSRNLSHPLLRPLRGWFEACLPRALGEGESASPEP